MGGTALIMAMIVVMLATSAAVAMASRQQLELRRLENTDRYDQALLQVGGIELWAQGLLAAMTAQGKPVSAATIEKQRFFSAIDGGDVTAHLIDLGGRFNINNLIKDGEVSVPDVRRFQRLLAIIGVDGGVMPAILDWLDPDASPRPGGAEDDYYSRLDPPYRAADAPLSDINELRLIRGVTPAVFQKLSRVVTVVPAYTYINVNAAPLQVIQCLDDGISAQDAEAIVTQQTAGGFANINEFMALLPKHGDGVDPTGLTTTSSFFGVVGRVRLGKNTMFVDSIINAPGFGAWPSVVNRKLSEPENG